MCCTWAHHGCQHLVLASFDEHVNQEINILDVRPLLQTMATVAVFSCRHHGMIKQDKRLYKVVLRWFEALHVVREGVRHLQNLALIQGSATCSNRLRKAT